MAERSERRRLVVVQLRVAFATQPLNRVSTTQQLPIGGERFVLARRQVGLPQFVQLEHDEIESRRPLAIVHAQPVELLAQPADAGECRRHLRTRRVETCPRVQREVLRDEQR